jgi:hypothetical protein
MKFVKHSSGFDLIPNSSFWLSLGGNIKVYFNQNYKNDNTYIYIYLNRMVSHLLEVKSDQGVVIIKQFNFTFIFLIDQVLIKFKKQNYFFNF